MRIAMRNSTSIKLPEILPAATAKEAPAVEDATVQSQSVAYKPSKPEPLLLDYIAAAAFLGISYWRMYGLAQRGEIKYLDIGGKFFFRRASLIRWAERAEKAHKVA